MESFLSQFTHNQLANAIVLAIVFVAFLATYLWD